MEQNRKPRDKSTHLWAPYLCQRRQEYTISLKIIFLTSGAGKTGQQDGNTCTPMVDSCQYMAKPIQYCKVKKIILILKNCNRKLSSQCDKKKRSQL